MGLASGLGYAKGMGNMDDVATLELPGNTIAHFETIMERFAHLYNGEWTSPAGRLLAFYRVAPPPEARQLSARATWEVLARDEAGGGAVVEAYEFPHCLYIDFFDGYSYDWTRWSRYECKEIGDAFVEFAEAVRTWFDPATLLPGGRTEPSASAGGNGHLTPLANAGARLPGRPSTLHKWARAYECMASYREEWRDAEAWGDKPPRLDDYRERLRGELGFTYCTRQISEILQAGDQGLLKLPIEKAAEGVEKC